METIQFTVPTEFSRGRRLPTIATVLFHGRPIASRKTVKGVDQTPLDHPMIFETVVDYHRLRPLRARETAPPPKE
jgi:hypothetical protein